MSDTYPGRWWHVIDDGRIQCDLCPRDCRLRDGQRGAAKRAFARLLRLSPSDSSAKRGLRLASR